MQVEQNNIVTNTTKQKPYTYNRCCGYTNLKKRRKCRAKIPLNKFYCCDKHKPYNYEDMIEDCCYMCVQKIENPRDLIYLKCKHIVHKPCYYNFLLHYSNHLTEVCIICMDKRVKQEKQEKKEKIKKINTMKIDVYNTTNPTNLDQILQLLHLPDLYYGTDEDEEDEEDDDNNENQDDENEDVNNDNNYCIDECFDACCNDYPNSFCMENNPDESLDTEYIEYIESTKTEQQPNNNFNENIIIIDNDANDDEYGMISFGTFPENKINVSTLDVDNDIKSGCHVI